MKTYIYIYILHIKLQTRQTGRGLMPRVCQSPPTPAVGQDSYVTNQYNLQVAPFFRLHLWIPTCVGVTCTNSKPGGVCGSRGKHHFFCDRLGQVVRKKGGCKGMQQFNIFNIQKDHLNDLRSVRSHSFF